VNSKTRKGMNPLMLAAAAGHTEAVDLLLKRRLVQVAGLCVMCCPVLG
jgi:ankyrin repeat protein